MRRYPRWTFVLLWIGIAIAATYHLGAWLAKEVW